jgi:Tfp pilus assembly protein PilF
MPADNDAAEVYYRKAIEADPSNAINLGKFAYFLHAVRGDKNMAHAHYERAVQCGNDADILGNFANFLETERDDHEQAELYYKQVRAAR